MNPNRDAKLSLEPIRFGEFLYEQQLLTDEQLLEVLADHWSNGGRIGSVVSRRGILSSAEVERQASIYHDGLDVIEVVEIEY
jgi:hypothetical protein